MHLKTEPNQNNFIFAHFTKMGILSDSLTVCRLCGLASEDTTDIFQHEGLSEDLSFYLPVEVSCHFLTLAVVKIKS